MRNEYIPFSKPTLLGTEQIAVNDCIFSGELSSGSRYTREVCEAISDLTGTANVRFLHSCTAALEAIFIALDLKPGDEIIMPSFTFTSTATSVALRNATPVFVDVEADTMNIDPNLLKKAITAKTKGVVVVHYAGNGANLDSIMEIARNNHIPVIEDAAQGIGAFYNGKHLGTIGDFGALSFHATKNINCSEGGALLINNPDYLEKIDVIIEKGTNRTAFANKEVDKYTWLDVGSSFVASELSAAFLIAQLKTLHDVTKAKLLLWEEYHRLFCQAERPPFKLPKTQQNSGHNGHIYYIILDRQIDRKDLLQKLHNKKIQAVSHYEPLHLSPAGLKFCKTSGTLKITEKQSRQLVRLPCWYGMNVTDVRKIVDCVIASCNNLLR